MNTKEMLLSLKQRLSRAIQEEDEKEIQEISKILENPKYNTDEYYTQENFTGYASIDKPHLKYFKKGVLDAEFPKMKMVDYLYLRNKKRLNFTALNFYGRKITYREMFEKIEETAKSFLQMGVKEGDHVVIAMPTTPESAYMLFALNRIGAVAVELDPRTTRKDIENTIYESKTKFYITMEDCCPIVDEILSSNEQINNQLNNVMFISPTESLPFGLNTLSDFKDSIERMKGNKPKVSKNNKYIDWHSFIVNGRNYKGKIDSEYKEGEVAEIIYSSGTTSTPKPIQYTNETFTSMVRQIELGENAYREGDKNLDIIPMFLGFGSNNALYTVLAFGLEDILIPVPVIEGLPALINKYKPNHILGAPIHMNVLLNYLRNNPTKMKDLSFLRSVVSGSAHLESAKQYALDDELSKRGCKIKVGPGYGQNESGPGLSFSSDTFLETKKPGCSGHPLSHVTISIFDPETDEELQYGQDNEGEIRYKTPCSMKGYAFDRQKENERYFKKGKDGSIWCCSGDLGKIDSDGGIYITGRITRQIGRNGFKFAPSEIEEFITSHISTLESCALIGRPDDIQENVPILYYSIKPEYLNMSAVIREEIIALCSTLKEYKIPEEYIELEKIPVTPNLKVDFKRLEREAVESYKASVKTLSKII